MAISGGRGTVVRMAVLALLWGSTFLWIKVALTGLSPVQVTVTRCALGTAVLAVLARAGRQRLPRDRALWGHLVVAAFFCNALPFALFSVGERHVDSGVAGVFNATTPLWSLLVGVVVGTERRLHPARLAGLLVGFAGTLLIFAPWHEAGLASWGSVTLLGAAASYAVAFTYMGRTLTGRGAPMAVSAAQLAVATALSALALPAGGLTPVHARPAAVAAVVMLGIFSTGCTFALNYRIIADEGATTAASVGYLLPVVSVALGAVVLGEDLGARVVAGMVVVLVGVAMTRWRSRPTAPVAGAAPTTQLAAEPEAGPVADHGDATVGQAGTTRPGPAERPAAPVTPPGRSRAGGRGRGRWRGAARRPARGCGPW